MKKLILKTAIITFGVTLILAISVFGIVSFCAPSVMMDLAASLGLESISGDYAYEEYLRSGDLEYLARSFVVSAENGDDADARARFELLIGDEEAFEALCEGRKAPDPSVSGGQELSFRQYIYLRAVGVKYRLARTGEEKSEAADLAVSSLLKEGKTFTPYNSVVALMLEAVNANDAPFCSVLLGKLESAGFEENADYLNIVTILEEHSHE